MFRKALPSVMLGALALICLRPAQSAVATSGITISGAGPYSINYTLAQQATSLTANIYTAAGTLIRSLDLSLDPTAGAPGKHDTSGTANPAIEWDGNKTDGTPAPRGTYYVEIVTAGDAKITPEMLFVANFARQAGSSEARNAYGGDVNRFPTSPLHNLGYFGAAMTNASGSQGLEVVSVDASSVLFQQDGASGAYDYVTASVLADQTILLGGQGKKKLRNVKATDGTLIADYAAGKVDVRSMQSFGSGANARTYFVDDQTPNGPLTGSIALLNPISKTTGTPIYDTIVTQAQIDTDAGLATGAVPGTRGLVVNRAETALWLCGGQASASGVHFLLRYDKVGGIWTKSSTFAPTVPQTARLSGLCLSPDESILYMTVGDPNDATASRIAAINPSTGADMPDYAFAPNPTFTADFQPVGITASASDANNNASTSYNLYVSGFRTFPAAVATGNSVMIVAPKDNGSSDKTRSDFFDVTLGATAVSVTGGPSVTNLTDTSATITWNTDFRSSSTVHYGGAPGTYNMPDVTAVETTTTHTVNLAGLAPGVTYYFQVESDRDPLTPATATGSFTTTPHLRIASETLAATTSSATLNITTNVAGDVLVHWGDTPSSFNKADITVTGGTAHAVNFTGLSADTTYYYQVVLSGAGAIGSTSPTSAFTTAAAGGSAGTVTDSNLAVAHTVDLVRTGGAVSLPVQGVPGTPVFSTALPQPIYDAGVVAYNGYLYCIGGSDSAGIVTAEVRYIKINADGTLDPNGWTVSATPLPSARSQIAGMVSAYNGRIYVAGGLDATTPAVAQDSVLYAVQNPTTGDLGPWQGLDGTGASINPMPGTRYRGSARVADGYLLVSGGAVGGVPQATDFAAPILPDGSLGPWFDAGPLDDARFLHRAVVNNHTAYIIGGQNSAGNPATAVDVAGVEPDGKLTPFAMATAYPGHADSVFDASTGRRGGAADMVSGKLVTVGSELRDVISGDINGTKLISYARVASDNLPQTWVDAVTTDPGAVLATNLTDVDGAAYNTTLYVVGGRAAFSRGAGVDAPDSAVADVLAIPMNPDPSDTGYATSGTLDSRVLDLGAMTNLKHISVAGTGVSASTVEVRYRAAGPAGVWSDWYTAGTDADISGGARFVQYQLVLKSSGPSTPAVSSVTLTTAAGTGSPLSTIDVKRALTIAAGLDVATSADIARLNVDGAAGVTLLDAVKIQRTINGR